MKARQIFTAAVLVAVLVAMALLLAACGSSTNSPSKGHGSGAVKPRIAVVSLAGSEYAAGYNRGFEREAKKLGLEVKVLNSPSVEVSDMTATINAAIATNPTYLLATAVNSKALRQPLLTAHERGIKVITYDTQVDKPNFVTTYVNVNYREYGEHAGTELGRLVGGKGKVMLDDIGPGNQALEELAAGFAKTLPQGVTELPVQYGQGENSKANAIVRGMLTSQPELTGVSAASAFGGEGTIAALREAGKIGKVKAVLLSATSFAISALRKGEVQVVVAEPLESIGERSIEAAYEDANGKTLPKMIVLPLCTITASTISDPKNAPCIQKKGA
jgi:ribose transport system substrate-binding protein